MGAEVGVGAGVRRDGGNCQCKIWEFRKMAFLLLLVKSFFEFKGIENILLRKKSFTIFKSNNIKKLKLEYFLLHETHSSIGF